MKSADTKQARFSQAHHDAQIAQWASRMYHAGNAWVAASEGGFEKAAAAATVGRLIDEGERLMRAPTDWGEPIKDPEQMREFVEGKPGDELLLEFRRIYRAGCDHGDERLEQLMRLAVSELVDRELARRSP